MAITSTKGRFRGPFLALVMAIGLVSVAINIVHWATDPEDPEDPVQAIISPISAQGGNEGCSVTQIDSDKDVAMTLQVEDAGDRCAWADELTSAAPEDEVAILLTYKNGSKKDQDGVSVRVVLPRGLEIKPASTRLRNRSYPSGAKTQDITSTGLPIGDYLPEAVAYVTFVAEVGDATVVPCGDTPLHVAGYADADDVDEVFSEITVTVVNDC